MVLDGETGAELASMRGHTDGVLGASWSPSGDRLATASWDSTVRIWDPSTGKESAILSGAGSYLYAVCWSPDGKQIAAGGGNRAVQIWDADTRRARTVLRGNQSDVWALAWSPDGSSLAATSEEGVTRLWDVRPGSAPGPGQVRPGWTQAGYSPDGTRIAVVLENDPHVSILDSVSGHLLRALGGTPPGRLWKARWSPDGTRVACSGWGWALVVWDVQTGEQVIKAVGDGGGRHFALAWSPTGDRVATGDDRGRICVWDSSSGRKLLEIPCTPEVWDLSWSPDGRQIAAARWDGMASVWDAATGGEVLTLRGHSGRVVSVGWSPDGKRIATGSYDRTVKLWDPATGQETLTLRGHTGLVREVHWHADGGRLTTRDGNNVLIWDAMPAFLAERSATSLRALAGRIQRDPADTTARRLRAEVLARQGDWDAAASDFSELARLPASAAAVYPAGWWALAGPEDQPPTFPSPAGAAPARWLAPADDPNGFVALPADGTTAVSHVFAPRRKMVALDIGPVTPGRLWLNEKAIGAAAHGPILVELQEGWNSLALGGRPGELYVRWRDFDKPADNAERLTLAQIAFDHKHFAAATRLWAEALETDSNLGGNRRAQYRYKAARAAVLAAAGHATNEPPLDDAAKARLRRQALDWLKAELAAWSKRLEPGSRASRPAIARALSDWEQNLELAGVRDSAALARFPEADRKEWQALWADFRDLIAAALFPDDPFAPAVSLPKPDGGVRALTTGEPVEEVRKELEKRNPGFDGSVAHRIEGGVVTQMSIIGKNVTELSPLRALLGLNVLSCTVGPPSDLSPLQGMPHTRLAFVFWKVHDLEPLKGVPLTLLPVQACTQVRDLEPLRGLKLKGLFIDGTGVTDLGPLQGTPLEEILLTPREITQGLDTLRGMSSLETIGISGLPHEKGPAAEFWDRYDNGEFKK
jgi:WD40 repeat protein